MALLIDGYNLLNATGIFGRDGRTRGLERARRGLLDFLAEGLAPADRAATTVVFDAQEAPPGLPRAVQYRELQVRYAPRSEEADDLIETLIRADTSPRQLTVVSSDHRIQRAARRRRARAVDSEVWFQELLRCRAQPAPEVDSKPEGPLPEIEVAAWLRRFTGEQS